MIYRPGRPDRPDRPDRPGDWGDWGDMEATRPYRLNRPNRRDRPKRRDRLAIGATNSLEKLYCATVTLRDSKKNL